MVHHRPESRPAAKQGRCSRELSVLLYLLLLLPSCASRPAEVYLETGRTASMNRILLSVSSTHLKVDYWTSKPFFGPPGLIEYLIRRGMDQHLAAEARPTLLKEYIQQRMRDVFREEFTRKPGCQLVDQPGGVEPMQHKQFHSQGFQAFIALTLVDLSLQRKEYGNRIDIQVELQGEMTDLATGQVIWSRRERAVSQESFPIDTYTENQGELIWTVTQQTVEKATRRLAYDLVYSR